MNINNDVKLMTQWKLFSNYAIISLIIYLTQVCPKTSLILLINNIDFKNTLIK